MNRYWGDASFASGAVLLAFSLVLLLSPDNTVVAIIIAIVSVVFLWSGKQRVDKSQ